MKSRFYFNAFWNRQQINDLDLIDNLDTIDSLLTNNYPIKSSAALVEHLDINRDMCTVQYIYGFL